MESRDIQLPIPQEDERTLAMLAHILQVFSWFMPPLVILVVKRQSRFVAFHAAQALLWQVIYFAAAILTMATGFAVILATSLTREGSGSASNQPPTAFFVAFPLIWLFWIGGWVTSLVLAIVYGIKANKGEWAEYPLVGRWARRLTVDSGRGAASPTTQP